MFRMIRDYPGGEVFTMFWYMMGHWAFRCRISMEDMRDKKGHW